MKTRISTRLPMVFLVAATVIAGCSSTRSTTSSQGDPSSGFVDKGYEMAPESEANQSNIMVYPNRKKPSNENLNDLISKLPGVRIVSDRGPYSKVVVTGMASSFIAETEPLFVVNGTAIGSEYAQVYSLVHPNDVISMSVLKGSDASVYGSRGANGVIVIRTR